MSVIFHQTKRVDGSVTNYHATEEGTIIQQVFDAEPAMQLAEWHRNGHIKDTDQEIRPVMFVPDTLFFDWLTKNKKDLGGVAVDDGDFFLSKKNIISLMKEYSKFNAVDKL
jgi:hypothetical protein